MPSVDEIAASALGGLNPILQAGVNLVSGDQTVTFTKYTRKVLPLDGYVFWVKSSLLGDTTAPVDIKGSLHWAAEKVQDETQAMSRTAVLFTSLADASQGFASLAPSEILIGSIAGDGSGTSIRFAFSRLGFYQNAGLFHYSGMAIFAPMFGQIVDTVGDLDLKNGVASNSLPIWIHLGNYAPTLPAYGFGNPHPIFPSFLVPANTAPPYAVIHIGKDATSPLASAPWLSNRSSHYQLARDVAQVTLFGYRGKEAMDFVDCVIQYSQDYDTMGLLSAPIVRDDQMAQPELGIIAAKKVIEFQVSYNQGVVRDVARQTIRVALSSFGVVFPKWG